MPPERRTTNWSSDPNFNLDYLLTQGPHGSPDPFECWLLTALARDAKVVLEIGTWWGRSATFLSRGLQPGATLTCVDWFQGDQTGGEGASLEGTRETFRRLGVQARIVDTDMHTVDWPTLFPEPVDLLFYDSDHSLEATTKALRAVHPVLAPNARVVVHDASFPCVKTAIEGLVIQGLYRESVFVEVWEGLSILQKN